jgi:hypothetical protein
MYGGRWIQEKSTAGILPIKRPIDRKCSTIEPKEKNMTAVLLLGWVALIVVSYKAAVAVLAKTNNL